MEIKSIDGRVLYTGEAATLRDLVATAVKEGANLEGANLRGAKLEGANLRGANLWGAKLNWNSHWLLSEILWRAAGEDEEKQWLAAWVGRRTDWCWGRWAEYQHPLCGWALDELARWVQPEDGAPELVRERVKAS